MSAVPLAGLVALPKILELQRRAFRDHGGLKTPGSVILWMPFLEWFQGNHFAVWLFGWIFGL